jgi:IMP cyclohydrolase
VYVGRFLIAGPGIGGYRVSSRSFPNRHTVDRGDRIAVEPTPDAPSTENPYVSYNCVRSAERNGTPVAALGNGSHVDPIAEKLELGHPPRDALAGSLLALDYERDEYETPRIAATVSADAAHVGIVQADALLVEAVDTPTLVATYERDRPSPVDFDATTAAEAAREVYDRDLEHPVCAAGVAVDGGVTTATHDGGSEANP